MLVPWPSQPPSQFVSIMALLPIKPKHDQNQQMHKQYVKHDSLLAMTMAVAQMVVAVAIVVMAIMAAVVVAVTVAKVMVTTHPTDAEKANNHQCTINGKLMYYNYCTKCWQAFRRAQASLSANTLTLLQMLAQALPAESNAPAPSTTRPPTSVPAPTPAPVLQVDSYGQLLCLAWGWHPKHTT